MNSVINSWAGHNNIEKEQQKTFINTTLQKYKSSIVINQLSFSLQPKNR